MVTKNLKLPRVVLSCKDYRFIASERADDPYHLLNVGINGKQYEIYVVTESLSKDSLGNERWSRCSFEEAKRAYVDERLRDSVLSGYLAEIPISKSSKKSIS